MIQELIKRLEEQEKAENQLRKFLKGCVGHYLVWLHNGENEQAGYIMRIAGIPGSTWLDVFSYSKNRDVRISPKQIKYISGELGKAEHLFAQQNTD